MAGGPSPNSTSPRGGTIVPGLFLPSTASPPQNSTNPPKPMSADVLSPAGMSSHSFNLSPIGERKPMDSSHNSLLSLNKLEASTSNADMESLPAVLMRKLPRNTSLDVLRTMLLFAKDMIDVNFVDSENHEDVGYLSAVARFMSLTGAHEARDKLNGKTISNDAKLMVELYQSGIGMSAGRRNTVDGTSLRHASSSASSAGSSGGQPNPATGRQSSRFNGTFQSLEKMSPPSGSAEKLPAPESNATIQSLFSPQSPLANSALSSKSMINDDPSDETGQLLNDPVAFAKSGENSQIAFARRTTNPQLPVTRFAGLSLLSTSSNTSMVSPPQSGFVSPRSTAPIQSPNGAFSPNAMSPLPGLGPGSSFQGNPQQHYQRHNYPPVNPADQNPPCNTLYVGNLPVDTSEDELKAMFSKQRGYKRLCFRTKQNGPMCFVEFEDTSFATKALNELYGHPLHNSVKGGIRLSFSKNPLGVRSGQQSSNGLQSPLSPHPGMQGMGGAGGVPPGFSTAMGPPPGLSAPPGLAGPPPPVNGGHINGSSTFRMYSPGGYAMGGGGYRQPLANTTMAGGHYPSSNEFYMGR